MTADVVDSLMPQLKADLHRLVAIPSISAPDYPEETHAQLHEAYEATAELFDDAGVGTVVSLMLPYVVILSIGWILFFAAWYLIGIPLGPGSSVHI